MQGLGVVKYPAAITLPQSAPFSVITISLMSRVRALTCFIAAELVKLYTFERSGGPGLAAATHL